MSINAAIAIYIIELEIPPQFLLHLPSENKAEGSHVFHEINISILSGKETNCDRNKLRELLLWSCFTLLLFRFTVERERPTNGIET